MVFLRKLASKKNLSLAWKRIRTSKDISYKKYFWTLYDSYEIAIEHNIANLSKKIDDNTYSPSEPIRILLPKSSGLQRPITLLSLEDQIVIQAFANLFSEKLLKKRRSVEQYGVCSNILNSDIKSIFFLQDWKKNYGLFKNRILKYYKDGNKFVADFDLSAFYDTVQHQLLGDVFSPLGGNKNFCDRFKKYMKELTPDKKQTVGIPQGPLSSNFLAECVLLPIDIYMKDRKYVRYVDDIRIFGENITNLKCAIADLEDVCRERGLIPHPSKFGIKRLSSIKDALNTTASLSYSQVKGTCFYDDEKLFLSCMNKRKTEIIDSSKAKHLLFHFTANENVLNQSLRLMPKYPELIDCFSCFYGRFGERRKIANTIIKLLQQEIPYGYLEGKYWEILSFCATNKQKKDINNLALKRLKNIESKKIRDYKRFSIKLGLFQFLTYPENNGIIQNIYDSLNCENKPLAKAILLSNINDHFSIDNIILRESLKDPSIDLGNIASWKLASIGLKPRNIGLLVRDLSNSSQFLLKELGLIGRKYIRYDPIGELIENIYSVKWDKWKVILGPDYKSGLAWLIMAEENFNSSPTTWMGCMDSFNDLLIRRVVDISHLKTSITNLPNTRNRRGHLTDYGGIIMMATPRTNNGFENNAKLMCDRLGKFHKRRNRLPTSHAKDKYTCSNAIPLNAVEKTESSKYKKYLETAYKQVVSFSNRNNLV